MQLLSQRILWAEKRKTVRVASGIIVNREKRHLARTSALVYCIVITNRHTGFLMVRSCPDNLLSDTQCVHRLFYCFSFGFSRFGFDLPLNFKLFFFWRRELEKFRGETAAQWRGSLTSCRSVSACWKWSLPLAKQACPVAEWLIIHVKMARRLLLLLLAQFGLWSLYSRSNRSSFSVITVIRRKESRGAESPFFTPHHWITFIRVFNFTTRTLPPFLLLSAVIPEVQQHKDKSKHLRTAAAWALLQAKRQACVFPAAAVLRFLTMKRRPRGLDPAHTDSSPPSTQIGWSINRLISTHKPDT